MEPRTLPLASLCRHGAARPARAVRPNETECPDGDLVALYAVVWAVSLGRVISAVAQHEAIGAEVTLALLAVLLLPLLLMAPLRWVLGARGRRPSRSSEARVSSPRVIELAARDRRLLPPAR